MLDLIHAIESIPLENACRWNYYDPTTHCQCLWGHLLTHAGVDVIKHEPRLFSISRLARHDPLVADAIARYSLTVDEAKNLQYHWDGADTMEFAKDHVLFIAKQYLEGKGALWQPSLI